MIDQGINEPAVPGRGGAASPGHATGWLLLGLIAAGFSFALAAPETNPVLLLAGAAAVMVGALTLMLVARRGYTVFWAYLTALLFGYMFLGKGFGYV